MYREAISNSSDVVKAIRKSTFRGSLLLVVHFTKSMMISHIQKVRDEASAGHSKRAQICREAFKDDTACVITVRNIPGTDVDPAPNDEDNELISDLIHGGDVLGFCYMDHIILSKQGHYSCRENGTGFKKGKYVLRVPPGVFACK